MFKLKFLLYYNFKFTIGKYYSVDGNFSKHCCNIVHLSLEVHRVSIHCLAIMWLNTLLPNTDNVKPGHHICDVTLKSCNSTYMYPQYSCPELGN